jgi:hypothetical protein
MQDRHRSGSIQTVGSEGSGAQPGQRFVAPFEQLLRWDGHLGARVLLAVPEPEGEVGLPSATTALSSSLFTCVIVFVWSDSLRCPSKGQIEGLFR